MAIASTQGSPIATEVMEMTSALQAKVIAEGEESQKVYEEFSTCCEGKAVALQKEIKTTIVRCKCKALGHSQVLRSCFRLAHTVVSATLTLTSSLAQLDPPLGWLRW